MSGMKVDIISRHTIKPSSPTPHHLRNFKLSFLDQLSPPFYGVIIFFYKSQTNSASSSCTSRISDMSFTLQDSLSKTLTTFYPLAGRLKDTSSIDCNDEGALFLEARVKCRLSDVLSQPNAELLDCFVPIDIKTIELSAGCMLLVQLSIFDCGGMAISVCLSHKITDASSLCTFLQSWTATARQSGEAVLPEFIGASLLQPKDPSIMPAIGTAAEKCTTKTRRFVFEASKIASLKNKATGAIGQQQHHPSRVEAVLALILKCAIGASRLALGLSRPSILFQTVDLRKRMTPPLPENSIGNLIWPCSVFIEESDKELHELAGKMRKWISYFYKDKANKFVGDEGISVICESIKERREHFKNTKDINSYRCASWCKFPLYETDFGWGKPIWVSSAVSQFRNTIILVDTKLGSGIEAWVTLEEQEMAIFERDQELLAYAFVNPSVSI